MRQKEVMGQSIRTSKSARPGTITYVSIDKSEFRSTVSSDKKKNKIMKIVVMLIVTILVMSCCVYAGISYYYSYHFFLELTVQIRQLMKLSRRLQGKRITMLFR